MLLAKGQYITFKYEGQAEEILTDVSFRVDSQSHIGIVGKNGSGKSTLLKIIRGALKGYTGSLKVKQDLKIGHLVQRVLVDDDCSVADYLWRTQPNLYELKVKLNGLTEEASNADWSILADFEAAGGYKFESLIDKIRDQLKLSEKLLSRKINTLSGGEKAKVGLLSILIGEPDLLLFDEPTNHLDLESLKWFRDFLKFTKLPYLVVSHDRDILNECISEIWELKKGFLKVFSGNYQSHKGQVKQDRVRQLELYEKQQKNISQLTSAATQRRVDADRMEKFKEKRSVKKNGGLCKRDEGSGSGLADPTKKMRSAKAVEKRMQLMIEKEEAKKPIIEKERKIILPVLEPCKSKNVLNLDCVQYSYDETQILTNISLQVSRGNRLAIVGPNGSGKTTLLKLISGVIPPNQGEIKWAPSSNTSCFYQDNADLKDSKTILEEVWQNESIDQSFARIVLGSLGLRNDSVYQKIKTLSPGERVKVSLAKTILSGANTLILDEPTNHLEVQAREMLEEALVKYEGTVIFVSHDISFIEKASTVIFDIESKSFNDDVKNWTRKTRG